MQQIYTPHTNSLKTVKDLKLTAHQEFDPLGKKRKRQYVEFTVIGTNRSWPDFMLLRDLKKPNPGVVVKGQS